MKKFLKNITGLEYAVCIIVLSFLVNVLGNKKNIYGEIIVVEYPTLTVIGALSLAVLSLYITYFRWSRLKLGNVFFVFFCIANLVVGFYAEVYGDKSFDDAMNYWMENPGSSYIPVALAPLTPLVNLFSIIMYLILIFKNVKENTRGNKQGKNNFDSSVSSPNMPDTVSPKYDEKWLNEEKIRLDKELNEPIFKDLKAVFADTELPNSLKNDLKNNTINKNLKNALLNTKAEDFRELEKLICKFYPDEAMIWNDEVEDFVSYKDIKGSTLFVDNDMNVDDSLGALAFLGKVKGVEKEKVVFEINTFKILDEKNPPFTDINGKWYNKFGNTIMRCVSEKKFEKELNSLLELNNIPKNSAKIIITEEMAEIINKSGGIPENMEPIKYYEGEGFNIELPPIEKGKPKIIVLKKSV